MAHQDKPISLGPRAACMVAWVASTAAVGTRVLTATAVVAAVVGTALDSAHRIRCAATDAAATSKVVRVEQVFPKVGRCQPMTPATARSHCLRCHYLQRHRHIDIVITATSALCSRRCDLRPVTCTLSYCAPQVVSVEAPVHTTRVVAAAVTAAVVVVPTRTAVAAVVAAT